MTVVAMLHNRMTVRSFREVVAERLPNRADITVREAAVCLGVTVASVRKRIAEGRLETVPAGRTKLIKAASLLRLVDQNSRAACKAGT